MITEKQKELRKKGIGGSDIGAIMGLNPYRTARDVYNIKKGLIQESESNSAEWGNRLESVIAQKFQERHLSDFVQLSPDTVVKGHKIANLDGLINDDGVLEIKTASAFSEEWDEGVPDYYKAQVQWYMGMTDRDYAYVVVLQGGQDYREYYIERDNEFIARAFNDADQFWYDFEHDTPPEAFNVDEANKVYPQGDKDTFIDANPELLKSINRLKELKDKMKELVSEEDELKTKVMNAMGSAEAVKNGAKTLCTWKTSKTSRFNQKGFQQDHADLYDKYKIESTYRTFRVAK